MHGHIMLKRICISIFKPFHFSTKVVQQELKNELIIKRYPFIRLIDSSSGKLIEPKRSDLVFAEKPDSFDLILVDGRQEPPIVRYQSQSEAFKQVIQREEAATKARLANKLKEMHLTTVTGEHDFSVKIGRVDEWIRKGWRVKIVIEEKRNKLGKGLTKPVDAKKELMNQIVAKLTGTAEIATSPELERGCLIFSLHATQKILSQLKQERSKANNNEK
jgi:translation initiation factor IF-3